MVELVKDGAPGVRMARAPGWMYRGLGLGVALIVATFGTESSAFTAKRYPFLPELTVNEMPAVCRPFHAAVVEVFKSDALNISVLDRDWPGLKPEWVFLRTSDGWSHKKRFYILEKTADLDGDGSSEVLVATRGYIRSDDAFGLLRFPSHSVLENALARSADRNTFESHAELLRKGSHWEMPNVAVINGMHVLLKPDPEWRDPSTQGLYRIPARGPLEKICEVALWPSEWGLGRPLEDLYAQIETMVGSRGGGGFCGTSPIWGNVARRAAKTRSRSVFRPWSLQEGRRYYMGRPEISQKLARWSEDNLWNFRQLRRLELAEAAASETLSTHYVEAFGVDEIEAKTEARRVVDVIVRRHFSFPTYEDSDAVARRGTPTARLERAALAGVPPAEIKQLLLEGASLAGEPTTRYEIGREPALFFALEHPDIVKFLLRRGSDVNATNAFGKTALMYAAQFDLLETAKLLVSAGADIHARTHKEAAACYFRVKTSGRTALMYAAENASRAMIEWLLGMGADGRAYDSRENEVAWYLERNTKLDHTDRESIKKALTR